MNGGPAVKTPILDTRAYNAVLNLVTNDLQARTRKRVLPSDWAPEPRPTDIRAGLPALLDAARHHGADLRCIAHGLKGSRKTLAHILALAPELNGKDAKPLSVWSLLGSGAGSRTAEMQSAPHGVNRAGL